MKANELMIGDWVKVTGEENLIHPAVSSLLPKNGMVVGIDGDCLYVDFTEHPFIAGDFEPIPLIPEILEKNGLRKLVTYGTEKWVCDNFRLNVYDSGETWRFCADTNRNEDSVIYVRFFHELQHALRLCGIEKTIEL